MSIDNDDQAKSDVRSTQSVDWTVFTGAADRVFNVWSGHPELEWAKTAWSHLRNHDLTRYSNERERHIVLLRFLTLGGVYRDFCQLAWDESVDKDYAYWAEPLKLDEGILARLHEELEEGHSLDELRSWEAWESIVESQRPVVVAAIMNGFGGEIDLIRSLWNSKDHEDFDADDDPFDLEPIAPGLSVARGRVRAMEWIIDGCYPLNW